MTPVKAPKAVRIESRAVRCILCILFCTIVVDGLLTEFLVRGGYGSEINPLLITLIDGGSFLPIKIAGAFFATLFLWIKYDDEPKAVRRVTLAALAVYTAIVYWNLAACLFVLLTQPI